MILQQVTLLTSLFLLLLSQLSFTEGLIVSPHHLSRPIFSSFSSPLPPVRSQVVQYRHLDIDSYPSALLGTLGNDHAQEENEGEKEDWRDFRAKLVMQFRDGRMTADKKHDSLSSEPTSSFLPSSWAYDAGQVIEQGSLICSKPNQDFGYGGLQQQYFHKTIIFVVHHDQTLTKGIIMNRPTTFVVDRNGDFQPKSSAAIKDEHKNGYRNYTENKWNVWFGGDVQGMEWPNEERNFLCLHTLSLPKVQLFSYPVLKNIYAIDWIAAKALVDEGICTPHDFWVFSGYCGWSPGQLQNELDRNDWYMVASDANTVLEVLSMHQKTEEQLQSKRSFHPPGILPDGIGIWNRMMERIGRGNDVDNAQYNFADKMVYEWVYWHLTRASKYLLVPQAKNFRHHLIPPGSILRSTLSHRPPFWPDDPIFHKSLMLILRDDDNLTIGVFLNRPSTSVISMKMTSAPSLPPSLRAIMTAKLPLRYGGKYGIRDFQQTSNNACWFYCNDMTALTNARIGSSVGQVGTVQGTIWACTREEAEMAVEIGLAQPHDFLVVSGFTAWTKTNPHQRNWSIHDELQLGDMEMVKDPNYIRRFWNLLKQQSFVSEHETLELNIKLSSLAWKLSKDEKQQHNQGRNENEETKQFNAPDATNNISTEDLADEALQRWTRTFLTRP